jgi:hypothetical protein
MKRRLSPWHVRMALLVALGGLPGLAIVHGQRPDAPPTRTAQKWTVDDALAQLAVYPRDPYLQYVAMQVARRENRLQAAGERVSQIVLDQPQEQRPNRAQQVDLLSLFTGALAVQESLQLDTMRGSARNPAAEKRRQEIIDIAKITGPTIKSHPWEKMLGGKKPEIEPLARLVPEDFYFVEFRSLTKLLELLDAGDLWSLHLFNQTTRQARTQQVGERLRRQLVIETNRLLRPLYDSVVEEVAVTGSDLFVAEGSDITLLFRLKQPEVFKARMDGFIAAAAKARPDAKRSEGEYLGVPYVHLTTPERDLHVFSAYPEAGLHVRSNSKAGFQRLLETIKGKTADGKEVRRLGDSTEFAYIRTLMPRGTKEEDGFIYLSDPFIRRLVGPQVKLTERRRMVCYNHLRMIGHAALLYRTEQGKAPGSLADLVKSECCPGPFNEGDLTCSDGGKYTLSADGLHGVCSHHGHAQALVPCCETPLAKVTGEEADEYKAFLDEYNRYWRIYFDPIALRVQVTPQRYRLETIVLPLIDNSIYTSLAAAFNGTPEPLDALPVPKRNIFSVAGRFNKEGAHTLLAMAGLDTPEARKQWEESAAQGLKLPVQDIRDLDVVGFVTKGLGSQVGLHVCDAPPLFDLDLPQLMGLMLGSFNGNRRDLDATALPASFLVASLNAPVYVSVPVQDAKIVDTFLDRLDKVLAVLAQQREPVFGPIQIEQDYYKSKLKTGATVRAYGFRFGPVKWRFFWGRIGGGLYLASKPMILEELAALEAQPREKGNPDIEATAHALVRLRPRNWNQVLADYRLGWAENNRQACLGNLGPLSSVGRAVRAENKVQGALDKQTLRLAEQFYAVHFFCPEGGRYELSADGKTCSCSVHGTAYAPRQEMAPSEATGPSKVLQTFGGLTASLTFLEDGLHAVVVLERK